LIPVKQDGSAIFYWLFRAKKNPETAPVVIWLTGGPGCSSEVAMVTENGPLNVNLETNDWQVNPWSWHTNFNLIFLDQPIGTGLSVVKNPKDYAATEGEVADMFYEWKNGFLKKYPEYVNR
jgi:cathepsin A (carboxypeptidase C)